MWKYFYPDGSPKQVIKFFQNPAVSAIDANILIGEYFDEKGRQQVTNGNGT